jgi:hypothetical protein
MLDAAGGEIECAFNLCTVIDNEEEFAAVPGLKTTS